MTLARASRVTPVVTLANAALADAVTARDPGMCRRGRQVLPRTGNRRGRSPAGPRRCHEAVERTADPQTEAATRIVAWVSGGLVRPAADDFGMLRPILLALLPQVGGILLMVGRGVDHANLA
ncbi:hypothetical protein [Bradyrhizobium sp.]|uniref:hypothetical protein n=1 Tax=Bradyrhizobium sp. TaxID=376 RepID=UPI003C1B091A